MCKNTKIDSWNWIWIQDWRYTDVLAFLVLLILLLLSMVGVGLIYGHIWNILAFLFIYLSTYLYSCYILHHSAVTRVQLLCLVEAGSKWPYWAFYFSSFPFFLGGLYNHTYMTHSQMLGKVESGWGPIFKVVLEC